jgi:hypothetical protein
MDTRPRPDPAWCTPTAHIERAPTKRVKQPSRRHPPPPGGGSRCGMAATHAECSLVVAHDHGRSAPWGHASARRKRVFWDGVSLVSTRPEPSFRCAPTSTIAWSSTATPPGRGVPAVGRRRSIGARGRPPGPRRHADGGPGLPSRGGADRRRGGRPDGAVVRFPRGCRRRRSGSPPGSPGRLPGLRKRHRPGLMPWSGGWAVRDSNP